MPVTANHAAMLHAQVGLIRQECKIIEISVFACESNNMPETARSLRLTRDILLTSARLIEIEAREAEEE